MVLRLGESAACSCWGPWRPGCPAMLLAATCWLAAWCFPQVAPSSSGSTQSKADAAGQAARKQLSFTDLVPLFDPAVEVSRSPRGGAVRTQLPPALIHSHGWNFIFTGFQKICRYILPMPRTHCQTLRKVSFPPSLFKTILL